MVESCSDDAADADVVDDVCGMLDDSWGICSSPMLV